MAAEPLGRRVFLARAAGLVLTLGSAPVAAARRVRPRGMAAGSPYDAGLWLAGDHHIHTRYSSDGRYEIAEQVAGAARSGLDFCVITDHGGPLHDKVLLQRAYPELVAARKAHPEMLLFQGLEWNIPEAEHSSVIVPPGESEAAVVAEFESRFDAHRPRPRPLGEDDAIAGVRFLQAQKDRPLFFANHPARRGLDSPHELRAWADAGPDVTRGFEGAPGHPAATLVGDLRGHYSVPAHPPGSFPGYPPESYRTFGGYDAYVAQVGGLWDSLLAEGRPFYITANSDSHSLTDNTVGMPFNLVTAATLPGPTFDVNTLNRAVLDGRSLGSNGPVIEATIEDATGTARPFSTTAFAPMMAPAPIRMSPRMRAPAPTITSSSMTG